MRGGWRDWEGGEEDEREIDGKTLVRTPSE